MVAALHTEQITVLDARKTRSNLKQRLYSHSKSLLFLGRFGEFERDLMHDLFYRTAANALGADSECFSRAVCRAHVYALEIRFELPPGNTGHLRAYSAKVFCLAAVGH
jgi:hypothetical protein